MFTEHDVTTTARITPSKVGQEQFLASGPGKHARDLSANPNLLPSTWERLWDERNVNRDPLTAKNLVASVKTPEQIERVLNEGGNRLLIDALVEAADISVSRKMAKRICDTLANSADFDELSAAACIHSGELEPGKVKPFLNVLEQALPTTHYAHFPEGCATWPYESAFTLYDVFTDAEVFSILEGRRRLYVGEFFAGDNLNARMLDHRPALAAMMLQSSEVEYFRPALAGCRHLFEPAQSEILAAIRSRGVAWDEDSFVHHTILALLSNPNASHGTKAGAILELIASATEEELLDDQDLVLRRERELQAEAAGDPVISTAWENLEGVEFELVRNYLRQEDHRGSYPTLKKLGSYYPFDTPLSNEQLRELYKRNPVVARSLSRTFENDFVLNELTPKLDKLGADAWYMFINMLPGWEEPLGDLVGMVAACTKIE